MYIRLALIAMFFFFSFFTKAQNITISGKLQDDETKKAVQGATIVLKSAKDTNFVHSVILQAGSGLQTYQGIRFLLVLVLWGI
jgi:hypothetical protein